MTTNARVLADSISNNEDRLTTLEVTFPRFILAEFNTHRAFSRNSASSRAIPAAKQLERIKNDPFVPRAFPINRPGMSASEYVRDGDAGYDHLRDVWLDARDSALESVSMLTAPGRNVHKQIASRLLEPFMWHTVIVSATEWGNFFALRISEFAQPEIREAAEAMRDAMGSSTPINIEGWHLPLTELDPESPDYEPDLTLEQLIKCSVARCAAVSYDRHLERDVDKELARYDMLASNGHLSPFEHAAQPSSDSYEWANFHGWRQARWFVERGLEVAA